MQSFHFVAAGALVGVAATLVTLAALSMVQSQAKRVVVKKRSSSPAIGMLVKKLVASGSKEYRAVRKHLEQELGR
jgi:hypothetical protein